MPYHNNNHQAEKENIGELEKIEKYSQKDVRIVYYSEW